MNGLRAGNYVITGTLSLKGTPESPASGFRFIYQSLKVEQNLDGISLLMKEDDDAVTGTVRDEQGGFPNAAVGNYGSLTVGLRSLISSWWNGVLNVASDGTVRNTNRGSYLLPGPVRAIIYGMAREYFVKSIRFDEENVTYRSFTLTPAGGTIKVVIAPGAAEVFGVVHDAKGSPESGMVTIWADGVAAGFSATTPVGRDGVFTFSNLPPGSYLLAAWEDVDAGVAQYPDFYRGFEKEATRVVLGGGERSSVELKGVARAVSEDWVAELR